MATPLNKKTGINLSKGSRISLKKENKILTSVCLGLNWGKIPQKVLFFTTYKDVDLDGSVSVFDAKGEVLETVYYRNTVSKDKAISHSGDDRGGDTVNDDIDNEIIFINLEQLRTDAHSIYIYLNSYSGESFGMLPHASIRIFEGKTYEVNSILATFNLENETAFKDCKSMILGKLLNTNVGWEFIAIGEGLRSNSISETISFIQNNYFQS